MQQLWVTWPLQPLQKTQLQLPFGPSVDLLCHPCITTTHLSYNSIFETSATALCGTTGTMSYAIQLWTCWARYGRAGHVPFCALPPDRTTRIFVSGFLWWQKPKVFLRRSRSLSECSLKLGILFALDHFTQPSCILQTPRSLFWSWILEPVSFKFWFRPFEMQSIWSCLHTM